MYLVDSAKGVFSRIRHAVENAESLSSTTHVDTDESAFVVPTGVPRRNVRINPTGELASDRSDESQRLPDGFPSTYNPTLPVLDATKTGFNYECFRKLSGGKERNSFPQPPKVTGFISVDTSGSGCQKNRQYAIGHAARCGLWIWTCMLHHRVVGYHVMPHGEGRRDCLLSLLRFKLDPPHAVWVDFACHAEETGLNWAPEYFRDVQWYHDTFHGFSHVCAGRFSSAGLADMKLMNTSIMEQMNSFLQPIRGVLRSGSMKVSTTSSTRLSH